MQIFSERQFISSAWYLPFLFKLYKRFCKGGSRYIDEFSLSLFEWRCCCIKVTAIGLVLFVQSLRPTFYLVGLRASLRQLSVVKSIIIPTVAARIAVDKLICWCIKCVVEEAIILLNLYCKLHGFCAGANTLKNRLISVAIELTAALL